MGLVNKVYRYIEKLHMIQSGDTVILALSGGADSVALLLVLKELSRQLSFSLRAVHVEHGIRGEESLLDAGFVKKLCMQQEIPLTVHSLDVPGYAAEKGLGLEEAARILRYQIFSEVGNGVKVALAHHLEDSAETVLFQLIRGSGLDGLTGISPIREEDGITFIRPLLGCSREEIEAYLSERNQCFCIDRTNSDNSYSRNKIRNEIMPELREINEAAPEHIADAADKLAMVKDYLEQEARSAFARCKKEDGLDVHLLCELHPALFTEVLRLAIFECSDSLKDIGAVHIEALMQLCQNQSGKKLDLPYGIEGRREGNLLLIRKCDANASEKVLAEEICIDAKQLEQARVSGEEIVINTPEKLVISVLPFDGDLSRIPKKSYIFWIDYDRLKSGFSVRTRREGDWFFLSAPHEKKLLNRYFIDAKIPESKRDTLPIIAVQDHVLWFDHRVCSSAYVTEATKWILEVKE